MRRSVSRIGAAIVVAVAVAGGCGLPDDREPQVITAQEAPLDLDPESPADNASSGSAEVTLYFVRDGVLVDVTRGVPAETVTDAIQALLARPSPEEEAANVRSEIPAETELISADVIEGIATIDLTCATGDDPTVALPSNCGIRGAEGTAQFTLFAQLVCTADAVPDVDGVLFLQEGTPQPAPIDGGLSSGAEPVQCADYGSVL